MDTGLAVDMNHHRSVGSLDEGDIVASMSPPQRARLTSAGQVSAIEIIDVDGMLPAVERDDEMADAGAPHLDGSSPSAGFDMQDHSRSPSTRARAFHAVVPPGVAGAAGGWPAR